MSKNVLAEIARLEGEVARIQRELEALRHSVGGSNRKTQALAAFKTDRPPAFVAAREPIDTPPPPSRDSKVRDTMAAMPAPTPSVPSVSEVVETHHESGRIETARRVGLSSPPPPHTNATPSRRGAAADPDAGRYATLGEGRSPRRR